MALMKEGLWRIVSGEETAPTGSKAEGAKFAEQKDRALATIVLSVGTSLLCLIGDPEDPVVIWKKLADQFEKKMWATRLAGFLPQTALVEIEGWRLGSGEHQSYDQTL